MELLFLGTGAGMPTKERNVTSIALTMYEERGSFWMFDCGEGTQHQVLKSPLRLSKLEKLFVTHLHGDHIFGLPGLLSSRSNQGGTASLTLYGPPGIKEYIRTSMQLSQSRMNYELNIIEIQEGIVFEDEQVSVSARMLDHRIDSYGYRIEEKPKLGTLLTEKLNGLGIRPGPLFGMLKRGMDVTLEDGTRIIAADVVGPPVPGRTIVILGDTRPSEGSAALAKRADVLVHEATFAQELSDLAKEYYHSTTKEAAQTAVEAEVKALILTHISGRYAQDGAQLLEEEARSLFPNAYVAHDFWSYEIPVKSREEI
ncbi:ribonuclease Z [Paenibacillus gansuensis]|uniref:Ribonuclease Z n=1 Tax=Paenibacillus gansuensis TaxID=306542 RepID=A0ABW5PA49_9BACL